MLFAVTLSAQDPQSGHGKPEPRDAEPQMAGVHWAKGQAPPSGGAPSSPNLSWHGGPIMDIAVVQPIFWGSSWSNASFTGDKITGLDTFYAGFGNTAFALTNSEYAGLDLTFRGGVAYNAHIMDYSSPPKNANNTSPILAEVCKMISNPVSNGYYPVYVDTPRGHAGFCAWHSAGSCNGISVQFAFFFNLDGDPGCDPQSSLSGSQGLKALANVSAHELSEAITDPRLNAWYDSSGAENADKCAWAFSGKSVKIGDIDWKLQGNWSNAAYSAKSGYPNSSGQKGCIDGN